MEQPEGGVVPKEVDFFVLFRYTVNVGGVAAPSSRRLERSTAGGLFGKIVVDFSVERDYTI